MSLKSQCQIPERYIDHRVIYLKLTFAKNNFIGNMILEVIKDNLDE